MTGEKNLEYEIQVPEDAIRAEQVSALYHYAPLTLAGTLALGATARVILADQQSIIAELNRFMWMIIAVVALRLGAYLLWRRSDQQGELGWGYLECAMAFLLSGVWNYLVYYVFPIPDPIGVANLIILVVGILAAGLVTQSVFMPAYFSYAMPMMIFSTIMVIVSRDDSLHLGIFGIAYTIMCVWFVLEINKSYRNSIEQRLRNALLVVALGEEKQKVEAANKAKSTFFAAASHDLRQPIHALSLFLGALKPNHDQAFIVNRMSNAVTGLQHLYDRVLDISKLESGMVEVQETVFDLAAVLQDSMDKHRVTAAGKVIELHEDLPRMWVKSDRVLLLRIFDNLVSNAIRYTSSGSVTVSLMRVRAEVQIKIRDTGCGVAPEELERMFDPYVQLSDAQASGHKGFGLGLSIVRSLSNLLDCAINVTSEPGVGTTFVISLEACNEEFVGSESEVIALDDDLHGQRILVLDDDPAIQEAMEMLLLSWSFEVSVVRSWAELEPAADGCDVLLTDYQLWDDKTGFDAIDTLRQIPCIMLTGDSKPEIRERCSVQAIPLLMKPLKPAQLRVAIHRASRQAGRVD